jgi:hypothetical protein
MGLGYLTAQQHERDRWKRLALGVDVTDTLTGLAHLLRRDVPVRAGTAMVALTGMYAAIGASDVAAKKRGQPSDLSIATAPATNSPFPSRGKQ